MLELRHISKTFYPGTVHEKTALQDLSLTLQTGDFVTILGSNGAGKSTLFNAVAGVFVVDSGRIVLDGQELTGMPDYKRSKFIGRMFQDPMRGTAPNMTIEENLALAFLRTNGKSSPFSVITRADRAAFREKLAQLGLGLEDRMQQPVGLLSGGQRQALTLLMATVVTPKLLLLDEHTAALRTAFQVPVPVNLRFQRPVQRQDRPAEPLAADGERNHLRTGAGVAIVQRKAVSVLAVAALPAYQAAGSSLLGRGYAVGGAVRPVFQRRQVLIGSFAHASLRFLWRVLFPRCLSIDELSQVYTFLTACAVYPRGRKSA